MQRREGARTRLRTVMVALGALGLLAGVATSCTGSEQDEAVVIDDGGTNAQLAAAVERTRESSGRIDVQMSYSVGDGAVPLGSSSAIVEFDGEAFRITTTTVVGSPVRGSEVVGSPVGGSEVDEEPRSFETTLLIIDGRTYAAVDDMYSSSDASGRSNLPDELASAQWVDVSEEVGGAAFSAAVTTNERDPFALLDSFSDVSETGTEQVDGIDLRRFEATMTAAEYRTAVGAASPEPDERMLDGASAEMVEHFRRLQAVWEYRAQHTTLHAIFLLTADGLLRRSVLDTSLDVEPTYSTCQALTSQTGSRTVSDYSDLGDDVRIEPPDPDVVVSSARAEELFQGAAAGGGFAPTTTAVASDDVGPTTSVLGEDDGSTATTLPGVNDGSTTTSVVEEWADETDGVGSTMVITDPFEGCPG